jgi:predicted small lipoprotein YifL
MKRVLLLLALAAAALFGGGCGNKGPLYLPDPATDVDGAAVTRDEE